MSTSSSPGPFSGSRSSGGGPRSPGGNSLSNIRVSQGAWLVLWVPCIIFAHVFAISWLLLALLKMRPQYAAALRRFSNWLWGSSCHKRNGSGGSAKAFPRQQQQQTWKPPLAPLAHIPSTSTHSQVPETDARGPTEPSPRPGSTEKATLRTAEQRRLWTPPLPSIPTAEPASFEIYGSHGGAAATPSNPCQHERPVPMPRPPPLQAQPARVPRRWTHIGASMVNQVPATAAAQEGPVAAAVVASGGGGGTTRRAVTMHHNVSDADLMEGGQNVRQFPPLLRRRVSRQTREIFSALAAQGVAPDLRVMRRVSSNVRRICIEWMDLGCVYDTSSGPKTVLKGVYGKAIPGDLLGLLGPSGAGKSTLLDVLAARKRVGRLSGQVLVDGKPRDDGTFVRRSAYVPQDDHFIPTLSAWEVITFHASLVLPTAAGRMGRRRRCAEVLAAMGLSRQGATLVGGTLPGGLVLRGLSGGERKRLGIATGIVAAPSALLLDEPTSGLDAAAALGVMQYMHALSQAGHVVLASVHQPRAAIWSMFTEVVVLSRGRMMYSGDQAGAVPWFTDGLGYSYDPQRHGVASDWIMDLVNTSFKKPRRIYGRMMTTDTQVEAAADAFLDRYREMRRDAHRPQNEQDEHAPPPLPSTQSRAPSAPEDAIACASVRNRELEPASPRAAQGDDETPLYDSLERARAASTAAAASAVVASFEGPPRAMTLDISPSLVVHRGSDERQSPTFVRSQHPRLQAQIAATDVNDTAADGGTSSVCATAGSPPLLPTTPRSNFLGSGCGASNSTSTSGTVAVNGNSVPIGHGSRGRSSGGGGSAVQELGSFGHGTKEGNGLSFVQCNPFNDLSKVTNCLSAPETQLQLVPVPPPPPPPPSSAPRGILRTTAPLPVVEDYRGVRVDGGGTGEPSLDPAAAKAMAAWSSGGGGGGGGGGGNSGKSDGWWGRAKMSQKRNLQKQELTRHQVQPGWIWQVQVLAWRELMAMTRNPADVAGRMLIFCWIAVVVGLIFYGIGDYFETIRSRLDVMYIETCVLLLLPYVYMSLYTSDKQYYMADLSAKLYSPSAYYVAKVLAVLPFHVLSMLVFSFTIYGMSGLRRDGSALAQHGLLATLAYLNASQVLYAAAVATPNQDMAFMVAIAWTAVNILMSNYLVRYDDMSEEWVSRALRWFSVMMWTFQGLAAAEYRDQLYSCASGFGTGVLSALPAYLPGNIGVRAIGGILADPGQDCSVDTNKILSYFSITLPFWRLAVILIGYLGVLHVITYCALRLTSGRERR